MKKKKKTKQQREVEETSLNWAPDFEEEDDWDEPDDSVSISIFINEPTVFYVHGIPWNIPWNSEKFHDYMEQRKKISLCP